MEHHYRNSEFSYGTMVIFQSYVNLPEGTLANMVYMAILAMTNMELVFQWIFCWINV